MLLVVKQARERIELLAERVDQVYIAMDTPRLDKASVAASVIYATAVPQPATATSSSVSTRANMFFRLPSVGADLISREVGTI